MSVENIIDQIAFAKLMYSLYDIKIVKSEYVKDQRILNLTFEGRIIPNMITLDVVIPEEEELI